jgi:hypothetical protein
VQANIHAFIILYVNRDICFEMHGLTILSLHALQVSGHNVIILSGGNALGNFSGMVGIKFPPGLFIGGAAD